MPLIPPLQLGEDPVTVRDNAAGFVKVIVPLIVQEFTSVTVTLYATPDDNPVFTETAVAPPADHKYVNAPVPPPAVAVALPFVPPLQLGEVPVTVKVRAGVTVNVIVPVIVHEFASVTVTLYTVAADNPVFTETAVAPPADHK